MPRTPRVGDVITVDLHGITIDGDCIGRTSNGSPVVVENGIPGETVDVRITASRRTLRGEIVRVVVPSPHRVSPVCQHFGPCGGCQWQHIAYPEQLRLKQRLCEQLLRGALGSTAPRVEPPMSGSPTAVAPRGYRSKVHFAIASCDGTPAAGHFRRHSAAILPVRECPVHAADGNAIAFAIVDELRRSGVPAASLDLQRGTLRHIVVRVAAGTAERLVTVVVRRIDRRVASALERAAAALEARAVSIHLNLHQQDDAYLFGNSTRKIHGRNRLREQIGDISYALSPTAFFQTNVAAAEILVRLVMAAVPAEASTVLDLYAGAGLFALPLARRGHRVIAVEDNTEAVADAVEARRLNSIDERRCRFVAARVEDAITRPLFRTPPDAVVLDPPRSGCEPRVLQHLLARMRPKVVVYVSCNPSALANDLAAARAFGYTADRVQPVDMFPHTAHVEAVAVLRTQLLFHQG